ncbi:N-acetylmuramoyl-L-alanine amidase-like domain-containing protein [Limibacterium fermenti]|uniref:N-acetylmuramoyl-L-alanine amidase-like domain-containing protein n=1 Tax=Limibacterium fermenti TaxID=3229863 RepID=UPI000E94BB88|nr:DUF1460 domain-containing protein [Porphyromonadaceae bacterium]
MKDINSPIIRVLTIVIFGLFIFTPHGKADIIGNRKDRATALTQKASIADKIVFTQQDKKIFASYLAFINNVQSLSINNILEKTALFFLNTPYTGQTLELNKEETLTVNLREFDCMTYVETVVALSETALSPNPSFETFTDKLRNIRYRNGNIQNYASRIHYTSDWMYETERKGVLENISQSLGGIRETKKIDFMSSHRQAYRQLKDDGTMWMAIRSIEETMNRRGGFYYLPKETILSAAARIPHMAVIAFTTTIGGLDTTHMGFAFRKDGKLSFIHASSTGGKIMIQPGTLYEYCDSQKSCTGIIVAEIK